MKKRIHLADDTIEQFELDNLGDWIKSNKRLTKGPLCLEFENEFSKWQGSKYSIFVNSGSSANLLVVQAMLEAGYLGNKTAIAPAVSWVTTVTPLMQLGFDVKLCDCDKGSLGCDVKHFEYLCKKHKPSIAILVHVLGHANDLVKIQEICRKYNVHLIEDACESLGSIYNDKKLGSHGLAGCFSFYYGHHMSTIEGGMVVTDDYDLYNIMLSIRSHGWGRDVADDIHDAWRNEYEIDEVRDLYTFYYSGFNLRSSDLNAFLGLSQLKKLDGICKSREDNFLMYAAQLEDFWQQSSGTTFLSSFAYSVLLENRLDVYRHMNKNGIEVRPLICGNIGLHPFWIKKNGVCHLPNADRVHNYGLYLPNHANLTKDEIEYVCDTFKEIAIPLQVDLHCFQPTPDHSLSISPQSSNASSTST